jgi:hypothetical protein
VWALIVWLVARALQQHGKVEQDVEGDDGPKGFEAVEVKS